MRRTALLFSLAVATVLGARAAHAEPPLVAVPDVAGKDAAGAKAAIAAVGLLAGVVEVDGAPADTVAAQVPAAGSYLPHGAVVVIDVRVKGGAGAPAPKAVGLTMAEATMAFGGLYDVAFQSVPGSAADRGKVVGQTPKMGEALSLRGRLMLSFVPDPLLPASVSVPATATLSPADAVEALATAGLHARIAHVVMPGAPPDVVVGQSPLPGTEAERYSTVYLVVTAAAEGAPGTPPPAEGNPATVPNVTGLTESSARTSLDDAGFDTTVEWVDGDPADAFLVRAQTPAAGETAPTGSAVTVQIVKFAPSMPTPPDTPQNQIAVPELVGLLHSQADDLLSSLGLVANPILETTNAAPPLRVFAQQVVPGTLVGVGTQIAFRVAKPPPPQFATPVPNFHGRTKSQALTMAALAGLSLSIFEVTTPIHPPHRVYSQSVPPYANVPLGTNVAVKLARPNLPPAIVAVPDLNGLSGAQAMTKLASFALAGNQSVVTTNAHPPYKVFWQWPTAGSGVPSGSTVQFKIAKPPVGWNAVPELNGLFKPQAIAALQAAGFQPNPQHVFQPPNPPNRVFWQSIAGGQPRPPGTVVTFKVMTLLASPVPDVITKTAAHATAALAAAGFGSSIQIVALAPGLPGRVFWQSPVGGASAPPGSTVVIKVKQGAGPTVVVPIVLTMSKVAATNALQALGLNVTHNNVAMPPSPATGKVIGQNPAGGQTVAVGATVHITIRVLGGGGVVAVPNLFAMTQAQAQAALAASGLGIDVDLVVTNLKPPGLVFAQNPGAGSWVGVGAIVEAKIAQAPAPGPMVGVPNLIGKSRLQALAILAAAGLSANPQAHANPFVPHQQVFFQFIAAGTPVPAWTVIKFRFRP